MFILDLKKYVDVFNHKQNDRMTTEIICFSLYLKYFFLLGGFMMSKSKAAKLQISQRGMSL